jgi:hypothetical protein
MSQAPGESGMVQEKADIRFHLVGMGLALTVILYVVWEASRHGERQFSVGEDRIVITAREKKGGVVAYYYEVVRAKEVRVVRTHFRDGGGWWPPQFKLVNGADVNVVGVVEWNEPQVLLVLYDVGSGRSWPADDDATGTRLLVSFAGIERRGYTMVESYKDEGGK